MEPGNTKYRSDVSFLVERKETFVVSICIQNGRLDAKEVTIKMRDLQAATRLANMAVSRSSASTKLGSL